MKGSTRSAMEILAAQDSTRKNFRDLKYKAKTKRRLEK
jgi:hypothetical protein